MALAILLGGLMAASRPALAQCRVSATPIAFGTYNVFSTSATDSTGSVVIRCNLTRLVLVSLGQGSSASYFPRTMRSGAVPPDYNIFTTSARTTIWGNGDGASDYVFAFAERRRDLTLVTYGRIPALQNVRAGDYSDTITVTVYF